MNKNVIFAYTSLVLSAAVLSACQGYTKVDQQMVATPDPVALRLASAADKASAALQTLASVEQTRNPGVAVQSVPYASEELRRTMSINWVGPIEPVMRRVAERAGYQVQVNGDVPPSPVVVTLSAKQKSVVEILRDLGLQAGTRADIVVDSDRHIVELNYAPVSGG